MTLLSSFFQSQKTPTLSKATPFFQAKAVCDPTFKIPSNNQRGAGELSGKGVPSTKSFTGPSLQKPIILQKNALDEKPHNQNPIGRSMEESLNEFSGSGRKLSTNERRFFEPRFGVDFSAVQVHTDTRANESARSINALAYTHGNHVVFGNNQYHPETKEGKKLMAHELTHVVQQNTSRISSPSIQRTACNFFVHDSTEPSSLGTAWKWSAHSLAKISAGGYRIPSGESIEEMMFRIISTYANEGCDCIEEIQFLSHGSSGNGMYISKTGDEFTAADFNIPELEKFGDGPRGTPAYNAWYDKLTTRQRRLVLLRRLICGKDAEIYYRSCQAFMGKSGQEFAKASSDFWRSTVIGHTKVIALSQPGRKVLKSGQDPYWSESEGTEAPSAKKPIGIGADQKPKK